MHQEQAESDFKRCRHYLLNSTAIKKENCRAFLSFDLAKAAITKSIQANYQLRPPASGDYLSPSQTHQLEGPPKKRWHQKERKKLIIEHQRLSST